MNRPRELDRLPSDCRNGLGEDDGRAGARVSNQDSPKPPICV